MRVAKFQGLIQGGVEILPLLRVGIGGRTSGAPWQSENANRFKPEIMEVSQGPVLSLDQRICGIQWLASGQLVVQLPEQIKLVETDFSKGLALQKESSLLDRQHIHPSQGSDLAAHARP